MTDKHGLDAAGLVERLRARVDAFMEDVWAMARCSSPTDRQYWAGNLRDRLIALASQPPAVAPDSWDAQIEADAHSGRLDALADKALADHQAGSTTPLFATGEAPAMPDPTPREPVAWADLDALATMRREHDPRNNRSAVSCVYPEEYDGFGERRTPLFTASPSVEALIAERCASAAREMIAAETLNETVASLKAAVVSLQSAEAENAALKAALEPLARAEWSEEHMSPLGLMSSDIARARATLQKETDK